MTTLEENNGVNVMEDENLAPKEAQRVKKKPGKEPKNPLKEKLVKREVAAKTNDEMKKSVEILSENVDLVKAKRGKGKKDGMTMKEDNQGTEETTPLAVASQVAEVTSTVAVETKAKKESPKKTQLGPKVEEKATQPTTEDEQGEASETQVPAKKGRGKKPKEPVKEKDPAVDVSGVSQPKAAEVKKGRGKAKVIVLEEVEQEEVTAAEVGETKEKEDVNPNTLQETEPATVVIAKKSRPGRPAKAATVENIEASQVPKAAPAKKGRGKKVVAKVVEDGTETSEDPEPTQKAEKREKATEVEEDVISSTKKLKEDEVEPEGPSPRQSTRTKGEVKYFDDMENKELPKKQRGKKALPKSVPFEEEGEKAAEPPKAKRGKRTEPSAFEEKKSRGGKKTVDAAKSTDNAPELQPEEESDASPAKKGKQEEEVQVPEKKTRGRKKKEDSVQQTQSAAEVEKKKPGRKKATGKAETDASSVQPKRIKTPKESDDAEPHVFYAFVPGQQSADPPVPKGHVLNSESTDDEIVPVSAPKRTYRRK